MRFLSPFVLFPASGGAQSGYSVTGPGSTDYEGDYPETGTNNSRPAYRLDSTHWLYHVAVGGEFDYWGLGASKGSEDLAYYVSSSAATPPLSGWQVGIGNIPEPTLSEL